MTQLERYIVAFAVSAASSEVVAALSIAARLPYVTPGAVVAFCVVFVAMLLLTRRPERRRAQPTEKAPCPADREGAVIQTPGRCCGETVRVLGGVGEVCAARWARALAAARERYEREKRRHARKARRADPAVARAAAMHTAYGRRRR